MIPDLLTKWFGKSWKTTLWGFASAVSIIALPALQQQRWPKPFEWALGFCMFMAGRAAKEKNVVGTDQPKGILEGGPTAPTTLADLAAKVMPSTVPPPGGDTPVAGAASTFTIGSGPTS